MNLGTWLLIGILFAIGFEGEIRVTPSSSKKTRQYRFLATVFLWPIFLGVICGMNWKETK